MNAKIGVVILNYMNYRDTAECVESILNQTYPNYEIIIVDNGSTNQSYEVLKFLFSDNPLVSLIKNERNMGFAKIEYTTTGIPVTDEDAAFMNHLAFYTGESMRSEYQAYQYIVKASR